MVKAAIVQNGVVENVVIVGQLSDIPGALDGTSASVGDTWDGSSFHRPVVVEPVPEIVSRFQGKAALATMGLLSTVEAFLDQYGSDLQKLAWTEVQEFRRFSPMILELAVPLNLTSAQLDDLFRLAATIEA